MRLANREFTDHLLPIALGQVIGMGFGILSVKLATKLIEPADYGHYGIFLAAAPVGATVVNVGVIKLIGRHWATAEARPALAQAAVGDFVRKLPWMLLVSAVVSAALGLPSWPGTLVALFFSASLLSVSALVQAALQSARSNWRDCAVMLTLAGTRALLPPLLYYAWWNSSAGLLAGFCAHAVLAVMAAGLAIRRDLRPRVDDPVESLVKPEYEGPLFAVLSLAGWLLTIWNRWLVAGFQGAESAGFFVLAGNIALIAAGLIGTVASQYYHPQFFRLPHGTAEERLRLAGTVDRVTLAYTTAALAGILVVRAIAPFLIGPLIDERYGAALPYIVPAGFFTVAVIAGTFFHAMLLAAERESGLARADLPAAAVLVAGSLVAASVGPESFRGWLIASPLVPWLVQRSLARRQLFQNQLN